MLASWLLFNVRLTSPGPFEVINGYHNRPPNQATKTQLRELLLEARFDPDFLSDYAADIGWTKTEELIRQSFPQRYPTKRGFFGEVLACAMLCSLEGYKVPIQKLRYAIQGDQTLPGTDAILVKLADDETVVEVCYLESKLRTVRANGTAVQAYQQLAPDVQARTPDMLSFTVERLKEQGDPLAEPLQNYMAKREGVTGIDNFRIYLTWEEDTWSEDVLQNLADEDIELDPLAVHVTRIAGLRSLIDELFALVGIEEVTEDDD